MEGHSLARYRVESISGKCFCSPATPIPAKIDEMGACVASLCASDWIGTVDVRSAEQAAVVDIPGGLCVLCVQQRGFKQRRWLAMVRVSSAVVPGRSFLKAEVFYPLRASDRTSLVTCLFKPQSNGWSADAHEHQNYKWPLFKRKSA